MYEIGTVLALKEQREPDEETGEEFAYNTVKVLGESPVQKTSRGDWTGADARGVIIQPTANFGGNLDEPFGKLRTLYNVESVPEPEAFPAAPMVVARPAAMGPTPEDVFAAEAPGVPPEEGQARGRTPLGDDGGPADADGPLGR